MKKIITLTLLAAVSIIAAAQINLAHVNKVNGIYIFSDADPVAEYDLLGEVTCNTYYDIGGSSIFFPGDASVNAKCDLADSDYMQVRDMLIQRAKIQYKDFDGLIISNVHSGINRGIPIKFKSDSPDNNQALVKKINGIYIFNDSKPANNYSTVDFVKFTPSAMQSADYLYVIEKFVHKCSKKSFNASNAAILNVEDRTAMTATFIHL